MKPLMAPIALEEYFLEARCKLLDVAGILDRIDRGEGANSTQTDERLSKVRQALEILGDANGARAERIQQLFSLTYDPEWERPQPRSV